MINTRSRGVASGRSYAAVLVLALALVTVSPAAAQGYVLTGCKWPSYAITFKNNFSGTYQTQGGHATENWSNATQVQLFQVTSNPDFTQINGNYGSTGNAGVTQYACSGGTFVKGVLIQINTFYADGYEPNRKQAVIAHEIGHAVGLAHRSTSTCSGRSLMYPTASGLWACGIYLVTQDDADGAAALY